MSLARSMDHFYRKRIRYYSQCSLDNLEEGLVHELMRQSAKFSSSRWRICCRHGKRQRVDFWPRSWPLMTKSSRNARYLYVDHFRSST